MRYHSVMFGLVPYLRLRKYPHSAQLTLSQRRSTPIHPHPPPCTHIRQARPPAILIASPAKNTIPLCNRAQRAVVATPALLLQRATNPHHTVLYQYLYYIFHFIHAPKFFSSVWKKKPISVVRTVGKCSTSVEYASYICCNKFSFNFYDLENLAHKTSFAQRKIRLQHDFLSWHTSNWASTRGWRR